MPDYAAMSAEELFDLYRLQGDDQALNYLLTQHKFRDDMDKAFYCAGVHNEDDREELLQEIFIYLVAKKDVYDRSKGQLTTFLRSKVIWLSNTLHKQNNDDVNNRTYKPNAARDEVFAIDDAALLSVNETAFHEAALRQAPDTQLIIKCLCNIIFDVLRSYDDAERDVLVYRLLLNKEYTEISDITGRNVNTLRTDYARVVDDVVTRLQERGFDRDALDQLGDDPEAFRVSRDDLGRLADETVRQCCTRYLFEGQSAANIAKTEGLKPAAVRRHVEAGIAELVNRLKRAVPAAAVAPLTPDELDAFAERLLVLGCVPLTRNAGRHPALATLKLLFRALTGGIAQKLALGARLRSLISRRSLSLDDTAKQLAVDPPTLALLLTDALPAVRLDEGLLQRIAATFNMAPEEVRALAAVSVSNPPLPPGGMRGTSKQQQDFWQKFTARLRQ